MDAFIYFAERLPCGLDELEDALHAVLGGRGEVTGSGAGRAGSNIDLFIEENSLSRDQALLLIRQTLAGYALRGPTKVVIDGTEHTVA